MDRMRSFGALLVLLAAILPVGAHRNSVGHIEDHTQALLAISSLGFNPQHDDDLFDRFAQGGPLLEPEVMKRVVQGPHNRIAEIVRHTEALQTLWDTGSEKRGLSEQALGEFLGSLGTIERLAAEIAEDVVLAQVDPGRATATSHLSWEGERPAQIQRAIDGLLSQARRLQMRLADLEARNAATVDVSDFNSPSIGSSARSIQGLAQQLIEQASR